MASAFENFVNAEIPLRISIDTPPVGGNLTAGKFLQATGVGLQVEQVDGGGGGDFVPYTGADKNLEMGNNSVVVGIDAYSETSVSKLLVTGFLTESDETLSYAIRDNIEIKPTKDTTTIYNGFNIALSADSLSTPHNFDIGGVSAFNASVIIAGSGSVGDIHGQRTSFLSFLSSRTVKSISGVAITPTGIATSITITNDVYGVFIGDMAGLYSSIGGTYYGVKQEGSTALNEFEGSIAIANDDNKLTFGAAQDAGIWYDGTNLQYNSRLVGTGINNFTGPVVVPTLGIGSAPYELPGFYIGMQIFPSADVTDSSIWGQLNGFSWDPTSDSGGAVGTQNTITVKGTNNTGPIQNNAAYITVNEGSGSINNLTLFDSSVTVNGPTQTRTVSNSLVGLRVRSLSSDGGQLAVASNAIGLELRDLSPILASVGGTYYGIKQEGATAINQFDGAIAIANDDTPITLGAANDGAIYWGSNNVIIDPKNAGTLSGDEGLLVKGPIMISFDQEAVPSQQASLQIYNTVTSSILPQYSAFRSIAVINPTANSTTLVTGVYANSGKAGSYNIGSMRSIWTVTALQAASSGTVASITGLDMLMNTATSNCTVTGNVHYLYARNLGTNNISVGGNVYQAQFVDLAGKFTPSGIYYGIKQEGATALNLFDGDTEIGSGKGLILTDKTLGTRHRIELDSGVVTVSSAL